MVADIVFIAIVLILAVVGYVKSFSGILTELLSVVCVVLGVILLTPQIVALFAKMGMEASIAKSLAGSFAKDPVLSTAVITGGETPVTLASALISAGLPAFVSNPASDLIAKLTPVEEGMKVADILATACAKIIDYAIAGVLLIIVICIVFSLLKKLFRLTHAVPALRILDGILGICLAVGIFVSIVMLAFAFVGKNESSDLAQKFINLVNQTEIWKDFYAHNLLGNVF